MSVSVPGAGLPAFLDDPSSIGPFQIISRLGAGRRTTAWIARRGGEAPVVLRELAAGQDPERFTAEIGSAPGFEGAQLELLRLPGVTAAHGRLAIGEDLGVVLGHGRAQGRPIELDIALAIAQGVAGRLARSGERRIHGDLLPHHVIVGYDGLVTLIDAAGAAHRERVGAAGRAGYRSPEQVRGDELSPASDVFQLGILLFELSTGVRLFDLPTPREIEAAILEGRLPRPREIIGDSYPIELQLVLRKLLRPVAAGRFQDGQAARDALRLVAASRAEVPPSALGEWMRRTFAERHARWCQWVGEAAGPPAEGRPPPERERARTASRVPTRLAPPPVVEDLMSPGDPRRALEESSPPPDARAREETTQVILSQKPTLSLEPGSEPGVTPTPLTDVEFLEAVRPAPSDAVPFGLLPEIPRLDRGPTAPTPTPVLELDPIDEQSATPTPPPALRMDPGREPSWEQSREAAPLPPPKEELRPPPETRDPADDFIRALESDWSERVAPLPLSPKRAAELAGADVDRLLDALAPPSRGAGSIADDLALRAEGPPDAPPPSGREGHSTDPDLPGPSHGSAIPADWIDQDEPRTRPSHASFDLAQDLLDGEFGEPPRTVRQATPEATAEAHDTIDEGSVFDVLPPGVVAEVLEASLAPPAAPLRRSPSRADTAPLPRYDTLPMQRLDAIPRGDTLPMIRLQGAPPARPAEQPAVPASEAKTLPGASPVPLATAALRAQLGIPPATTAPQAAKPRLEVNEEARAPATPLWTESAALLAEAPTETRTGGAPAKKRSVEAHIPTQVVRERVVPNVPPAKTPRLSLDDPPRESERAAPQARVPTQVVRERLSSAPAPSTVASVAVSEPIVPEDSSSVSLVIPISDETLARAQRRKRTVLFTVAVASLLVLIVALATMLFAWSREAEPVQVESEPAPSAPRRAPSLDPPLAPSGTATRAALGQRAAPSPAAPIAPVEQPARAETASAAAAPAASAPPALRRVKMQVRPEGAKVFLDGAPWLERGHLDLAGGEHELVIEKAGFVPERRTLGPDTQEVYVLLKRKPRP